MFIVYKYEDRELCTENFKIFLDLLQSLFWQTDVKQ